MHLGTLVAGFALIAVVDRHLWFFGDEWNFIADRGLHHAAAGIWQPHNEHWSTLPILLWRALFSLFALGSYWPYLLPLLLAHIATAHIVWRIGRAEGAGQWVATACAAVFVALGAGAENLTWAFQIGFVGSLMFGWSAVLLVSRQQSAKNEVVVATLLLAALACSTVGNAMWVTAAVVLVCRRGWKAALRPLAAPAVLYVSWYLSAGRKGVAADHITASTFIGLPRYVWGGLSGSLGGVVDFRPVGPALLVILIGWLFLSFGRLRRESPSVLGGAAGALIFFVLAGLGRYGQPGPTSSRYIYVCVAFLLPAVMVAATRVTQGRRSATSAIALALVALLLGVNIQMLVSFAGTRTTLVQANRRQLLDIATWLAEGTPSLSTHPVPLDPDLNTTTIVRFAHDGTLPAVRMTASDRLEAAVGLEVGAFPRPQTAAGGRFVLLGVSGGDAAISPAGCVHLKPVVRQVALRPVAGAATLEMESAPSVTFSVFLVLKASAKTPGAVLETEPSGKTYVVDLVPDELLIVSLPSRGGSTLCGLRP